MKLWTKEIEEAAKKVPLYCDDGKPLATRKILVKYFYPCGAATWYITEVDPQDFVMPDGRKTKYLYGYVTLTGEEYEWGPVLLAELEDFNGMMGIGIERDLAFAPLKEEIGKYRKELVEIDKAQEEYDRALKEEQSADAHANG